MALERERLSAPMLSVFASARRHPNALAIQSGELALSFAELATRVGAVATELAARDLLSIAPEPIGVVVRPTLQSVIWLQALIAYQVPFLPLHPRLPLNSRQRLVERARARAVLVPDEQPPPRADGTPPVPPAKEAPTSTLAIVATSGSSGQPKLVVLSRGAFVASARASAANLPLAEGDRWLLCLPPSHIGGLSIVTRCLLSGAAIELWDSGDGGLLARVDELVALVPRRDVSVISLVPAVLDAALATKANNGWSPGLRAILLGGAASPTRLVEHALSRQLPLLLTYGLTEACSQVTTTPSGSQPRLLDRRVSSGRPLPGVELRLGAQQRIEIRGPMLCTGFVDAPAPFSADGWLLTEDRGELDERGELFVLGRTSDLIVTGGENVDPRVVEARLLALPGVREACVFALPDPRFGELVACALVTDDRFDVERWAAPLGAWLAPHERPRRWARVGAIPLTTNGKRDLSALLERVAPVLRPVPEARP